MQFFGMGALVPLLVALAYGEPGQTTPFLITSLACMIIGSVADMVSHWHAEPSFRTTCFMLIGIIVLTSLAGAIPFIMNAHLLFSPESRLMDGIFESVSAITTTGFSVMLSQESAPRAIVFWRSFMQWMGGMGIVVMFFTFFLSHGRSAVSAASLSGIDRVKPNLRNSAKLIFRIYLAYSALVFAAFLAAGVPVFDSAIHAMSGIATGGFSSRSVLSGFPPAFFVILAGAMLLGAVSFVVHDNLKSLRLKAVAENAELRMFLLVIAAGSVLLHSDFGSSWGSSTFHAISAAATAGYSFWDLHGLSELSKSVMALLMFVGGCYSSTAGGIKVVRFGVLLGSVKWMVKKIFMPQRAVIPLRMGRKSLFENEVLTTYVIFLLYALTALAGMFAIAALGYGLADSLFESVSALATTGLSTGIVGPFAPAAVKAVLMAEMLLGRLEIIPFFVLLMGRIGWDETAPSSSIDNLKT